MKTVQRSPEPFFYPGGKTGILLIHGFTGTPSELRPMGQYFKDRGYTVHAPLLAGHGTSPEEMEQTGWRDWWQSAVDAYDRMRAEPLEKLYVAGLSMGGCLSLALAAQKPVDGVIPMCAPIYIRDRRAFLARVVAPFYRYKKRSSHRDPHIEAHLCPYDRTPVRCVAELTRLIRHVKSMLADVKVPALIVQAGKDELILEKSADYIYEHISSTDKEISWYERSTHIITVDRERNELFKEIEQFILERSS
ncbi:carboxylesterase [Laceyella sacchari]|uniref:alpha/beta hydrolase n=1 Tax=Laceyella sacchari TaxID=37482 RepID=UPI00104FC14B|nr:alpha/beta fold hydrolase [Laceyella sacchari]TCW39076.1 carboxylesterase [Laceyella sacchari]